MKFGKKKVIFIIVIILIIMVIFIGYKALINKKANNKELNSLTPEDIIELLSYVPYTQAIVKPYDSAYCGQSVKTENIIDMLLFFKSKYYDYSNRNDKNNKVLKKIKNDSLKDEVDFDLFSKDEINDYLTKTYNVKFDSIKNSLKYIKINDLNKEYVALIYEGNTNFRVITRFLISVTDAYINYDEIIVTEKTIFYEVKNDKYYIYKNTNMISDNDVIKVYNVVDENGIKLSDNEILTRMEEDFKDYNYGFKHTFKKNNTGYYWYSTEYVKINN